MQNWPSKFILISFQSSNFAFVHFSPPTFKFIQLRLFHQLLLYVVVNFSIFKIFLQIFKIKKIQLMIEKYFPNLLFQKTLTKVDGKTLIESI